MMRRTFIVIASILFSSYSFADSGGAIIPHIFKNSCCNETLVFVTNITNQMVTVHIDLYDQNGNYYTEATETGTNFSIGGFGADPVNTNVATLGPQETGWVMLVKAGVDLRGFGRVSWESTGHENVALIAHVMQNYNDDAGTDYRYSRHAVPVNNYEPF